MTRAILTAALALAAIGFGSASEAKAQYTVYIWNMRTNAGWLRSGFAHDVYTSKQACLNSINSRVAENKRWRTDFEAFAVVKTGARPGAGYLNATNVRTWWQGQIRYIPANTWYNITVMNDRNPRPTAPGLDGTGTDSPLFRRETDVVNA